MSKAEKITQYLAKHPNVSAKDASDKFGVHASYIYALRRKMNEVPEDPTPGPTPEHEAAAQTEAAMGRASRTAAEEDERLRKYFAGLAATNVDAVLDSRAKDYGKFIDGAEIMQMLKRLVHNYIAKRGTPLAFDQREAIDMIIHKLGRIINGNPDKVDHWVDIAGYSTLVADRLQGDAR